MKLTGEDERTGARQHAVDDRRRDGAKPLPELQPRPENLDQAGRDHDDAESFQPLVANQLIDDHGKTGCRSADLQWSAGEPSDNKARDDAGDNAGAGWSARGNRDADAKR